MTDDEWLEDDECDDEDTDWCMVCNGVFLQDDLHYIVGSDGVVAAVLCEECKLDVEAQAKPSAYPRCRICGGDSVDHHGRNCDDCRANHDGRATR